MVYGHFDCGYNVVGGKGRQIGWTSIMGLLAVKKMIFQSNYYIKFVTEDKDTGEEIFSDKIKYPFGALPRWMMPKVKSDSGTRFWLSDKTAKGAKGYPNSRLDVVAPKNTAINGGSPQLALIDEIGNIGILGAMLNEARPTMFWNNPKTGSMTVQNAQGNNVNPFTFAPANDTLAQAKTLLSDSGQVTFNSNIANLKNSIEGIYASNGGSTPTDISNQALNRVLAILLILMAWRSLL